MLLVLVNFVLFLLLFRFSVCLSSPYSLFIPLDSTKIFQNAITAIYFIYSASGADIISSTFRYNQVGILANNAYVSVTNVTNSNFYGNSVHGAKFTYLQLLLLVYELCLSLLEITHICCLLVVILQTTR